MICDRISSERGAGCPPSAHPTEPFHIPPVIPPIRSSDLRLLLGDPFDYFCRRRLGLVAPTGYAEALARGTWLHEQFRRMGLGDEERRAEIEALLATRVGALASIFASQGLSHDAARERLATEERDCRTAAAWWEAAVALKFGTDRRSLRERLGRPGWREVCREFTFAADMPVRPREQGNGLPVPHECRVQPDLLLYDEERSRLWIVDLKSCSGSTLGRLTACPDEFQTQLYCAVIERLLARGVVQRRFGLPLDCALGGMIHVAVRKPTIEFGPNDRDFLVDTTPLKTGPRKGQPRNEKRYVGEPRFENYLRRVGEWFRAEADFVDRAAEWAIDPPVNLSETPVELLREPARSLHLQARLDLLASFARRPAEPSRFAPSEPIRYGQSESPYGPFRHAPPETWASVAEVHGFVVRHREEGDIELVRAPRFALAERQPLVSA
jgi:hypothetical protein